MSNKNGCTVKQIVYELSDTVEFQGKQEKAAKYLKKGYYVKESRNGYWVLIKPSKVLVTLAVSDEEVTVNLKECILDFYDKKRISQKTIDNFAQQLEKREIAIFPSHSWYEIRKIM